MTDDTTPPTVPNSTILRFLEASGIDIATLRKRLSMGCYEALRGNAIDVEIDGVKLVVSEGCVFVARDPTTKLKVELGSVKG